MQLSFTGLVARLSTKNHSVITFEQGRFLSRSFGQVAIDIGMAVERLRGWGVRPGMRVGIRAPNCYNWLVYDMALIVAGAVSLAFTDDFSGSSAEELCDRYDLALLLVTGHELRRQPDRPAYVVDVDTPAEMVALRPSPPPSADASAPGSWLIFSSGSAGGVKGIVVNRPGVEHAVDAFVETVGSQVNDCLLLFLPLSNFQQRLMCYAAFHYGFDIILTEPGRLFAALTECNPTILIAPPLLYETIETRFHDLPTWQRKLVLALGRLIRQIPLGALRHWLQESLFKSVHQRFGTRMRFMITGMAPIKRSTLELFSIFGLPLFETYGLIESGPLTLNIPGANRHGTVGRPLPGVHVEIAGDGEVMIRRNQLQATGYFECTPGEGERTFVGPGQLATGDIGRVDADGFLHLLGRKKELIVTAGGEKIHPEVIEAEINTCPEVAKAVVIVNEETRDLSVVVVPRNAADQAARQRIDRFIAAVSDQHAGFALSAVFYADEPFSRENGFLRPNLKLDRRRIASFFLCRPGAAAGILSTNPAGSELHAEASD